MVAVMVSLVAVCGVDKGISSMKQAASYQPSVNNPET
jgi:hypothetical protein